MIVVTGGAGFIGSCLVWELNQAGYSDIVVIDDLLSGPKWLNLRKRQLLNIIGIEESLPWLQDNKKNIEFIFHMGACSTTTEQNADYLIKNNLHYSMSIFDYCTANKIPLVYASSAATYGAGESGYSDDPKLLSQLRPINKYGYSKQLFDHWAIRQKKTPPMWVGLKFFNVYGPNEYHKGSQASVVYHAFPQVRDKNVLKLFRSYREGIADGEQKRDFIYVKDVTKVLTHFLKSPLEARSGIFNLGTGEARTFIDLGTAVFNAMEAGPENFDWMDMPPDLIHQYQYFTQSDLARLRKVAGYKAEFYSLESGVADYLQSHLMREDSYL